MIQIPWPTLSYFMHDKMYEIINIGETTLLFSRLKGYQTASLGFFIRGGSRYEKRHLRGIAHFLEHLLFKGSRNYSYLRIKREIEGRGGSLNGFTSPELTAYYAQFLNRNLKPTLDILADMVFYPILKKEDVEKERKVILEEIKMHDDLPAPRALSILESLIWKGHPLGQDVIGTSLTVSKIGRNELLDFKRSCYLPANVIVCCVADCDKEEIVELLKKKIKPLNRKAKLINKPPRPLRGISIKFEEKQLEQVHLCLGFRSPSYSSKDFLVVDLINVILGANMSSRLFEELREKKALCYDISTEVRKYKDSGAFIIHLGLDKQKITVALKGIFKELKKILQEEVALKEFTRAKDFFLGQVVMGLERPSGCMIYLAESYLTLGKILTFAEIERKIEAITPSRIKKLANQIFSLKNMAISCVGEAPRSTAAIVKAIAKKESSY